LAGETAFFKVGIERRKPEKYFLKNVNTIFN